MSNDLLISSRCLIILFLRGLYEQLKSHFLLCRLISIKKTLCKREIMTKYFSRYVPQDLQYDSLSVFIAVKSKRYMVAFDQKWTIWKAIISFGFKIISMSIEPLISQWIYIEICEDWLVHIINPNILNRTPKIVWNEKSRNIFYSLTNISFSMSKLNKEFFFFFFLYKGFL